VRWPPRSRSAGHREPHHAGADAVIGTLDPNCHRSTCSNSKGRHLIDYFLYQLKEFKCITLRADKTNQSFAAMIHLTAAVINSG